MSNLLNHLPTNSANLIGDKQFAYPVHPSYTEFREQWSRIRDVLAGSDAVKARTTKYLPKLSAQETQDYLAYLNRALFLNSSARIVNTNVGTIIRRSPTLKYDQDMSMYFELDDSSMYSFREVFRYINYELTSVGRTGILIEIDDKNNRPIPVKVNTENIINWLKDDDGNLLSVLLYRKKSTVDPMTFEVEDVDVYYRLYLSNEDGNSIYTVVETNENGETIGAPVQPSLQGNTLDFIPFVVGNAIGIDIEPIKSPMIDVVDVNLSHFRTSADLETGRHFVGLPQPVVTGATAQSDLHVGSSKAWVIPSEKAKASYLEFVGQGLDGLARALAEKESQMSQFSAQLMDTGSKGSEAEGTVRLRYSSDAANLSSIAATAESMLRMVYKIIAGWSGKNTPDIELNKDFISDKLTYNELRELTKSWMEGGLTDEEFRWNLKRGEIIAQDSEGQSVRINSQNNSGDKPTDEEEVE